MGLGTRCVAGPHRADLHSPWDLAPRIPDGSLVLLIPVSLRAERERHVRGSQRPTGGRARFPQGTGATADSCHRPLCFYIHFTT